MFGLSGLGAVGETRPGIGIEFNTWGEQDARPWANAIAKTRRILTWDFSLTEGENAVYPHSGEVRNHL